MLRIYRLMKRDDESGGPLTGFGRDRLSVRTPRDIEPDEAGIVQPGKGAMSVGATLRAVLQRLPPWAIPERFSYLAPDASGRNNTWIWRMGEGAFLATAVSQDLLLRLDGLDSDHGCVEPGEPMSIEQYQAALADTQPQWSIEEPETV